MLISHTAIEHVLTGPKGMLWRFNRETMNIPNVTIRQLLEAGVHLGHKTLRWNPKMKQFIFGEKDSIHIIDLTKTLPLIKNAMKEVHKCISAGGKVLIVSTKKQAAENVLKLANETNQFYVNYRWLGGMLTNWKTIQNSIKRLKKLDQDLSKEDIGFTKKEVLKLGKERDKLKRSLGGISDMNKVPDMLFIIDTNTESLAIKEAVKLNIPIVAILDTNSDPSNINFPIPGNDDARRSINLYCEVLKETILDAKKNIAKKQVENEKKEIEVKEVKKDKDIEKKPKIKKILKNISKKQ